MKDGGGDTLERLFEHEELVVVSDARSGLRGAVAIHSTRRGPACGGLRIARYATLDAAVADVLALARAMTLKSAAAGLDLGGGKAVLVDDGRWDEADVRRARLMAFAVVLERLGGRYVTAEDVGTTPDDMELIGTVTEHVTGRPRRSGDPAPATALTVLGAIRDAVQVHLGRDLTGVRVGVLGVGSVGRRVAEHLTEAGATLLVSDSDTARAVAVARALGATVLPLDGFVAADFDVLVPCALGGAVRREDVPSLRCAIIAGAANNPLTDGAAEACAARDILYVPDFLANCGGIIQVGAEVLGLDAQQVQATMDSARARTRWLLETAAVSGQMPLSLALDYAQAQLEAPADDTR
jgi:leucine dehydrogenase